MKYISTRGNGEELDSAEAIIRGLAGDGGLFVPSRMPQIPLNFIERFGKISYEERAEGILSLFLSDYTTVELVECVEGAYGNDKFDDVHRAPVKAVGDFSVLELWHGPTSAFKDMALQLLPRLMSTALKKTGEEKEILILVATSGDTGKAALEGFCDVDQIRIMVFYPEGGVSRIQRLQMLTQKGKNVNVTAVRGNFDDAQSGVKAIFSDAEFNEKLAAAGVKLSSANSINWGRLVPQIVYYFSAYADLLEEGRIKAGDEVNFCVPTGNFGDILAAYYARKMGLPIHRLICASNCNNVLTDFLRTGIYNRKREFHKTISPSMDILISSNLERLLYHVTGDPAQVKNWMESLADTGTYDVGAGVLEEIQKTFWAGWTDEQSTKETIRRVYEERNYTLDTHTAVAWNVAEQYVKETGDRHEMIVVSTASPYKFNASVLEAMGESTDGMDEFRLLDRLKEKSGQPIPKGLDSLRSAREIHLDVCGRTEMEDVVYRFAASKK